MNNRNIQQNDTTDQKEKEKSVWKTIGIIALSLGLALLTVFIINLNR